MSAPQQTLTIQQALDLAAQHHNSGHLPQAETIYQQILQTNPNHPIALQLLGVIAHQTGKNGLAIDRFTKALALKPDYPESHNNLGIALKSMGKLEQAIKSYETALRLKPDYADAHYNLGNALRQSGNVNGAIGSYRKAISYNPNHAKSHSNLGLALQDIGKLEEAVIGHQRACTIRPEYFEAHSNLIFAMSYIPKITGKDILREARRWNTQHAYRGIISKHKNTPDPNRRLRVGLVSGDFRNHSISYFLQTILSAINPEKLEIFAYSTVGTEDNQTDWFKSIVAKWRKVAATSDEDLAKNIITDGIDILVDLSGHTAHNRLKMFSRKPAPIEVTWLGIGGTTGVEAIDYVLCDYRVLPPSDETHFVEKPWRLPDIWVCFSPPNIDVDVGILPALANGHLTFGCFNNLAKMTDLTVACWALVLQAVPNSYLFLKAPQLDDDRLRQQVVSRFQDHSIGPSRLILEGSSSREELLTSYQRVDIALDPFPHSGGATSLEALWMGVPFITLKGNRWLTHMGETILHSVGLKPWIAATPEEYTATAKSFASDPKQLSLLRKGLRTKLLKSPVCDAIRFTRNLEDAFRKMWKQWCNQQQT